MAAENFERIPKTKAGEQRGRVPPVPPASIGTIEGRDDGPFVLRRLIEEMEGALEEIAQRHTNDQRNFEVLEAHARFLHSIAVTLQSKLSEQLENP